METYTNDNLIAKNDGNDISLNDDVSLAAILYRLARYELIGTPEMIEERLERQAREIKLVKTRQELKENGDYKAKCDLLLYEVEKKDRMIKEYEIKLEQWRRTACEYKEKLDKTLQDVEAKEELLKAIEVAVVEMARYVQQATRQVRGLIKAELLTLYQPTGGDLDENES